ncbi:hypothetical protein B0H11DRAFT_1908009 [Mycena galericulata]|nr:hypothetical protein B0H11DRAFT_1908009 [Mycena galericulata]
MGYYNKETKYAPKLNGDRSQRKKEGKKVETSRNGGLEQGWRRGRRWRWGGDRRMGKRVEKGGVRKAGLPRALRKPHESGKGPNDTPAGDIGMNTLILEVRNPKAGLKIKSRRRCWREGGSVHRSSKGSYSRSSLSETAADTTQGRRWVCGRGFVKGTSESVWASVFHVTSSAIFCASSSNRKNRRSCGGRIGSRENGSDVLHGEGDGCRGEIPFEFGGTGNDDSVADSSVVPYDWNLVDLRMYVYGVSPSASILARRGCDITIREQRAALRVEIGSRGFKSASGRVALSEEFRRDWQGIGGAGDRVV